MTTSQTLTYHDLTAEEFGVWREMCATGQGRGAADARVFAMARSRIHGHPSEQMARRRAELTPFERSQMDRENRAIGRAERHS